MDAWDPMNVTFRNEIGRSTAAGPGSRLALVEVFDDLAAAEPIWRRLTLEGALSTPYQNFDLAALWQQHVGTPAGIKPFIVAGFDTEGRTLFLLPLCRHQSGPITVAQFLGGKHSTINFGIWRRDYVASVTAGEMQRMLKGLGSGVDVLTLFNQPYNWDGCKNPFVLLPHQHASEDNFRLTLGAPGEEIVKRQISAGMRGRLRNKERKLNVLAGYRHFRVTDATGVTRYLDAFFAQKAARLAAQGLRNVFAEPGIEAFLRAGCHLGLTSGKPLIELYVLEGGDEMLALYSGIHDGRRFTSMFNSYTLSEHARWSPGLILLQHMVADCAERGFESFDVGAGEARYKTFFCKEIEPLFDSILPLTSRGRVVAAAMRPAHAAKAAVKRSPILWGAVQTLRRRFARHSA
ncbi:MAG: GNAT family N-acetyltransferase [Rhizobiales bacterium]|nr:GNAT family N-acetyltransferase [Hyphomicrobiales bacterium]